MIKFIITFCLLTFCLLNIKAQNHISEGVISDNGSNINLNIASISILKAKDLFFTLQQDQMLTAILNSKTQKLENIFYLSLIQNT